MKLNVPSAQGCWSLFTKAGGLTETELEMYKAQNPQLFQTQKKIHVLDEIGSPQTHQFVNWGQRETDWCKSRAINHNIRPTWWYCYAARHRCSLSRKAEFSNLVPTWILWTYFSEGSHWFSRVQMNEERWSSFTSTKTCRGVSWYSYPHWKKRSLGWQNGQLAKRFLRQGSIEAVLVQMRQNSPEGGHLFQLFVDTWGASTNGFHKNYLMQGENVPAAILDSYNIQIYRVWRFTSVPLLLYTQKEMAQSTLDRAHNTCQLVPFSRPTYAEEKNEKWKTWEGGTKARLYLVCGCFSFHFKGPGGNRTRENRTLQSRNCPAVHDPLKIAKMTP